MRPDVRGNVTLGIQSPMPTIVYGCDFAIGEVIATHRL